ncbi:MAG: hypothetical protein PHD11_06180, partial [Bacteroidales bacterium]|nr:hypothetical protein [Bacteroidales bacterium]
MKKLLLTFVFAMAIGAISSFAIGDEEEFDIILEETSERGTRGGTTPLECAYIVDLSLLRVNCLEDVGTVTVSVRNTSTGDVITDSFNSVSGQA